MGRILISSMLFIITMSCGGGSTKSRLGGTLSCPNLTPGHICTNGQQLAMLGGMCSTPGPNPTDCPPFYNYCDSNNRCATQVTPGSGQIWFATDAIRPGVTALSSSNSNDYIYNIMAKGYDSLDDWCMSQAQQSTIPGMKNISSWTALIIAAPDAFGFTVNNYAAASTNQQLGRGQRRFDSVANMALSVLTNHTIPFLQPGGITQVGVNVSDKNRNKIAGVGTRGYVPSWSGIGGVGGGFTPGWGSGTGINTGCTAPSNGAYGICSDAGSDTYFLGPVSVTNQQGSDVTTVDISAPMWSQDCSEGTGHPWSQTANHGSVMIIPAPYSGPGACTQYEFIGFLRSGDFGAGYGFNGGCGGYANDTCNNDVTNLTPIYFDYDNQSCIGQGSFQTPLVGLNIGCQTAQYIVCLANQS